MKKLRIITAFTLFLLLNSQEIQAKKDAKAEKLIVALKAGDCANAIKQASTISDPNYVDEVGVYLLHYCIEKKCIGVIKTLLDKGANPDVVSQYRNSALSYASEGGNVEIVRLLLDNGAIINLKSEFGETSLFNAIRYGGMDVVKLLLERGAFINFRGSSGQTPLIIASQRGSFEVIVYLLEKGANINLESDDGESALLSALKYKRADVAKLLIEKGAQLDSQRSNQESELMIASSKGMNDIVRLLIDKGSNVNKQNSNGKTALMYASESGKIDIVKLLLEKGANIKMKNTAGFNALMYATQYKQNDVAEFLRNYVSNSDLKTSEEVKDVDGNVYKTAIIGKRVWMLENLKTTHYRNGEAIPIITNNAQWLNYYNDASCIYNNNSENINKYGRLYNWYAANDPRGLAPLGWHVPSESEWTELINSLKSNNTDITADDFNGLRGGIRFGDGGNFSTIGQIGYWSSSRPNKDYYSQVFHVISTFDGYPDNSKTGNYVRCIKDNPSTEFRIINNLKCNMDFAFAIPDKTKNDWKVSGWYNVTAESEKVMDFGVKYDQLYFYCNSSSSAHTNGKDAGFNIDQQKAFNYYQSQGVGTKVNFKKLDVYQLHCSESGLSSTFINLINTSVKTVYLALALYDPNKRDYQLVGWYTLNPKEKKQINLNYLIELENVYYYYEWNDIGGIWKKDNSSNIDAKKFNISDNGIKFSYMNSENKGNRAIWFSKDVSQSDCLIEDGVVSIYLFPMIIEKSKY